MKGQFQLLNLLPIDLQEYELWLTKVATLGCSDEWMVSGGSYRLGQNQFHSLTLKKQSEVDDEVN